VNRQLAAGRRVREVRQGGAVMKKLGEDGDAVRLALGGCQIEIVFEDA
jgi:hypothetical protein